MAKKSNFSPAPGDDGGAVGSAPRRATRSQSREPQVPQQSTSRRTRGGSKQRDLESSAIDGLHAMMAQTGGQRVDGRNLETVDEESGQTFGILNDVDPKNAFAGGSQYRRLDSLDRFSQVTRATTFSQDEIQNMDVDTILGDLPVFYSMAQTILTTVAPVNADPDRLEQIVTDLLEPRSSLRKGLQGRLRAFDALKAGFGQQTFVNPEHVLRFLLRLSPEEQVLNAAWRPDDIFYTTNLVGILQLLFQSQGNSNIAEALELLDTRFPTFALSSLLPEGEVMSLVGESNLAGPAQEVALALRTQLFIFSLQQEMTRPEDDRESPELILARVFASGSGDGEVNLAEAPLRVFNKVLTSTNSDIFYDRVRERVLILQTIIERSGGNAELSHSHLESEFPLDDFLYATVAWIQERHRELSKLVEGRGGLDSILKYLEQEVRQVNQDNTDPALAPGRNQVVPSKNLASKANILAMRQHRASLHGRSGSTQTPSIIDGGSVGVRPDDDDFDSLRALSEHNRMSVDTTQALADRLDQDYMPIAQDNQENRRFIDQQEGAHRVAFEDTQSQINSSSRAPGSSVPAASASRSAPAQNRRALKRPRVEEDEDPDFEPTQEGDFQTDPRAHSVPHRAPQANMGPPPASSRNVLPRTSGAADVSQPQTVRRERQNPGRSIPMDAYSTLDRGEERPDPTPGQVYRDANLKARILTSQKSKPPRQREKWSDEQEDRLIALLAECGPMYSHMKKLDHSSEQIFYNREAEDLRLKARNMKVDYLKSRIELPPGFEQVLLGKKEIDRLYQFGIDYVQDGVRSTSHQRSQG